MAIVGPTTRAALRRFETSDVVEDLRVFHDRVRVAFADGLVETWDLDGTRKRGLRLPRQGLWGTEPFEVSQYNSLRLLDDDYDPAADMLFEYTRPGVRRAGWLDQRLLVHRLVLRLLEEGWIRPAFPQEALQEDLDWLRTDPQRLAPSPGYIRGQAGRPVAGPPPGFLLCLDLLDWGPLAAPGRPTLTEAWSDPRRLRWAIEGQVRRGQSVTRSSIIHRLVCGASEGVPSKAGPRWTPPSYWIAVLRDVLGLEHRPLVIDAGRDCGSRAVATAVLGGVYFHDPALVLKSDGPLWETGAVIEPDDEGQGAYVAFVDSATVKQFKAGIERCEGRADVVVSALPWSARDDVLGLPGVRVVRYRPRPYLPDAVLAVWEAS